MVFTIWCFCILAPTAVCSSNLLEIFHYLSHYVHGLPLFHLSVSCHFYKFLRSPLCWHSSHVSIPYQPFNFNILYCVKLELIQLVPLHYLIISNVILSCHTPTPSSILHFQCSKLVCISFSHILYLWTICSNTLNYCFVHPLCPYQFLPISC